MRTVEGKSEGRDIPSYQPAAHNERKEDHRLLYSTGVIG